MVGDAVQPMGARSLFIIIIDDAAKMCPTGARRLFFKIMFSTSRSQVSTTIELKCFYAGAFFFFGKGGVVGDYGHTHTHKFC